MQIWRERMRNNQAKAIATGGMLAALAMVVMCLGGLIPIATYVCPMLCALVLQFVLRLCGKRIAWAWYIAVAILSLLLAPDKKAAVIFVFLGYYPIIKPWLDALRLSWLFKLIFFNGMILAAYAVLIYVLGLTAVLEELAALGTVMTGITLLMGNVVLFMLDFVLAKIHRLLGKK